MDASAAKLPGRTAKNTSGELSTQPLAGEAANNTFHSTLRTSAEQMDETTQTSLRSSAESRAGHRASSPPAGSSSAVKRACESCRQKHRACDGKRPCRCCKVDRIACREAPACSAARVTPHFVNLDRVAHPAHHLLRLGPVANFTSSFQPNISFSNSATTEGACFFEFQVGPSPAASEPAAPAAVTIPSPVLPSVSHGASSRPGRSSSQANDKKHARKRSAISPHPHPERESNNSPASDVPSPAPPMLGTPGLKRGSSGSLTSSASSPATAIGSSSPSYPAAPSPGPLSFFGSVLTLSDHVHTPMAHRPLPGYPAMQTFQQQQKQPLPVVYHSSAPLAPPKPLSLPSAPLATSMPPLRSVEVSAHQAAMLLANMQQLPPLSLAPPTPARTGISIRDLLSD